MINPLTNQLRQQMANVIGNLGFTKMGLVDTYDPKTITCVVEYQPRNEDGTKNLSPILPIACLAIGNGFGVICAPRIGDQVAVDFENADTQLGIVRCGIFSDGDVPPEVQSGEYYLIHETGSFIKFLEDGKLSINGNTEIDITTPIINITTTGNVTLDVGGNMTADVTGDLNVMAAIASIIASTSAALTAPSISLGASGGTPDPLVKLAELQAAFDAHVHSGVQTGGGNTGAPTVSLPGSLGTTIVKAE